MQSPQLFNQGQEPVDTFSIQGFFDLCPDMLAIINSDGYFQEVNPAWERVLGWTKTELRSRPWLEFLHPDDKLMTMVVLKLAARNQITTNKQNNGNSTAKPSLSSPPYKSDPYTFQNRFRNKDRTYSYFSWSISPYLDNCIYVTVRDISEHISVRDNSGNLPLQYPQEFSKLLVSASFDGILAFDREYRYTLWNAGMEKIVDISADEVIGKCAFEVFPFLKENGDDHYFYAALAGENMVARERPYRSPNGKTGFFEAYYGPLRDYLGRIIGGLAIVRDISDHKLSEEKLQESLSLLEAVIESSVDSIFIKDVQGIYKLINSAALQSIKLTKEQVIGHKDISIFPATYASLIAATDARIIASGQAEILEERMEIEGVLHTFLSSKNVYRDSQDQIVGLVGISKDITERKQMEVALAKSESHYRALVEHSFDVVAILDTYGIRRFVSPNVTKVLGYAPEDLIDKSAFENIHPDDVLKAETTFGKLLQQPDVPIKIEIRFLHANGRWVNLELVATNLLHEPHIQSIVINLRDITARKQAEQALQESEEFLRLALESAQIGTWNLDLLVNKVKYSDQIGPMFGLPRGFSHNTYEDFLDSVYVEDRGYINSVVMSAIDDGRPFQSEFRVQWLDGTIHWLGVRGEVYYNEQNGAIRLVGVTIDITERKITEAVLQRSREQLEQLVQERTTELTNTNLELQIEIAERKQVEQRLAQLAQELKRSNLELEQFAYVASHDLQEPLRAVTSFTQLLQQYYSNDLDAKAEKYMSYIVDGATRMQQLINDLLTFSRVGRGDLKLAVVDCNVVLEGVLKNLQVAIAESNTIITTHNLPITLSVDAAQFSQLLQNLIANAIKFRRTEPEISINAVLEPGMWHFCITDNGIGIEAPYLDRIFIIFQRLHTRREYPGTGIGLALCKKIVERHNGRIWVSSKFGEGTTFHFTIPLTISQEDST